MLAVILLTHLGKRKMKESTVFTVLTVVLCFLSLIQVVVARSHDQKRHQAHHHPAGQDLITLTPSATISARGFDLTSLGNIAMPCLTTSGCIAAPTQTLSCNEINGLAYTEASNGNNWTISCDVDYPEEQNIYPFASFPNFETCLLFCDNWNLLGGEPKCAGFVFAPGRVQDANDCYMKYALDNPSPATIHLIGATSLGSQPVSVPTTAPPSSNVATAASAQEQNNKVKTPAISDVKLLGTSTNKPTTQYLKHDLAKPVDLGATLLDTDINIDLILNYPVAPDTGCWTSQSATSMTLTDLSITPHLSRDGGKGGEINGTHIFIFCDTATYQSNNMVAFVSSSVATDSGMSGLYGNALTLVDQIGEWQDDVGRLRGLAPMTTGEEAFNIAVSGLGYRYAVWPESSPIPLNCTHSLLYASLVYDQVDMSTQEANFTTLGNTLLVVGVDSTYGPSAQRISKQLFKENEVAWGSLGGFRAWGESGIGGMDGSIYLFGQVNDGVLVARTTPSGIADRSTYTYWDGSEWSSGMLPATATSYFLNTPVMDLDVIYSPFHRTFIMVYVTPKADNTFYYRYLNTSTPINPAYEGGTDAYAEALVKNSWSEEKKLYNTAAPCELFIYAGGVHAGYFGDEGITKGGTKMLISWTQHTCQDASSAASGYAHMTAVVTFE